MLKEKQQAVACAILRRRHPHTALLDLPAIAAEVPNPFQAKSSRHTVPVLTADGRQIGRRHIVKGLTPVTIDQSGNIRCAVTGRTLYIAPGSTIDRVNPGVALWLNPSYKPVMHQVVVNHSEEVK
ncbi:hypothetical protein [Aeromonas veronii]|uniref:hypothetical protein n=1 Tax=Aeromonas veronii TaxID=654 RepID=UPI003D1AA365